MGWIADLLQEIPSAARYKAELEAMEKENGVLKNEKSSLKLELEKLRGEVEHQKKSQSERLSEEPEKILQLLADNERLTAAQIANDLSIKSPLVDMHLHDLNESEHVGLSFTVEEEPEYFIQQEGRRYLNARGLL